MNCKFFQSLVGLYQNQLWKNFEENFEKINRGDPFLKNLPWGTKGKNLKKKFKIKILIKQFWDIQWGRSMMLFFHAWCRGIAASCIILGWPALCSPGFFWPFCNLVTICMMPRYFDPSRVSMVKSMHDAVVFRPGYFDTLSNSSSLKKVATWLFSVLEQI